MEHPTRITGEKSSNLITQCLCGSFPEFLFHTWSLSLSVRKTFSVALSTYSQIRHYILRIIKFPIYLLQVDSKEAFHWRKTRRDEIQDHQWAEHGPPHPFYTGATQALCLTLWMRSVDASKNTACLNSYLNVSYFSNLNFFSTIPSRPSSYGCSFQISLTKIRKC